jgi:peroxiredoxin/mono/diheme cytochrome c family protein
MTSQAPLGQAFVLGLLLCGSGPATAAPSDRSEATKPIAFGEAAPIGNSLRDLHGEHRALRDFKGRSAIVVVFLGTECPISNLYLSGLVDLEKKYRSRKVQFLAIYPHESEDLDQVAAHSYDHDVPFPVLKDFGQKLADGLGVKRVPSVAVLDGGFVLRYRGRVDDQYGVATRRTAATRADLKLALDEVLAGTKVSVPETDADGCLIERVGKTSTTTGVTYGKEVSRILQARCQNCHRPGQSAPFSLMNYDDAVKHGRMIREVTTQRRMPPWHADPRYGHFTNDRRLSSTEVETVAAWVDADMPRGDDRDLPPPVVWPKGWVHGEPDLVFTMPEEYEVPATGSLPYQYWVVDTKFAEDKWVQIAEARPGTPSVVHHVVVYIMKDGQTVPFSPDGTLSVLVGWAPGDLGLVCPPDTALRIPKGAKLRFELHYTPNGKATRDRSSVGLIFAKKPPRFELFTNSFANESILLPPRDPHYRAESSLRMAADARIISFVPHMHWRGKNYFYEVIYPDGRHETLLSVPRWDFNWQNVYQLKEPLKLPVGARLHAVAHWDNSTNNPLNPDADKSVSFGLQTWDEMMVGWVAYVWERPETAEELAKHPVDMADLFFNRLDVNGDDVLTPDEIPSRMKPLLLLNGVALPDKLTREEFRKLFAEFRKRMPNRRPAPTPRNGDEKKQEAGEAKKPESKGG